MQSMFKYIINEIRLQDEKIVAEHIKAMINERWEEEAEVIEYAMRDPLLFGDFRNAINEEEPRFYEDLLDYEAVYTLFLEVINYFSVRNNYRIFLYLCLIEKERMLLLRWAIFEYSKTKPLRKVLTTFEINIVLLKLPVNSL